MSPDNVMKRGLYALVCVENMQMMLRVEAVSVLLALSSVEIGRRIVRGKVGYVNVEL